MHSSRNYRGSAKMVNPDEDHLDRLNMSGAESLSVKVSQLKNLALDLEDESKDHLSLLDDMDDNMETGSMRLGGTSNRLRNMGRTRGMGGRKLSCYIGLIITSFFIFVYYFVLPLTRK